MEFKDFTPYIIGLLLLLIVAILVIPGSATASESSGYYLDGHAIIGYQNGIFYLDNNFTILLDPKNESTYLPLLEFNKTGVSNKLTFTQTTNYADALIQPSRNWSEYPAYDPENATHIQQGDYTYLGETIDFSGNGWYTGTIYYNGPYEDGYSLSVGLNDTLEHVSVNSRNLSKFYLDPEHYSDKLGWWYSGYVSPSTHGNDRLFYVGAYKKTETITEMIRKKIAMNQEEIKAAIIKNMTMMPEKRESNHGIIISRNVTTSLPAPFKDARYWIFGSGLQNTTLYDHPLEYPGIIELTKPLTANLKEGTYDIIFLQPDNIGQYEQTYDPEKHSISSPFRNTPDVVIYGYDGPIVERFLETQIKGSSQSNYSKYLVNLQDPEVDVQKMDAWNFGPNNTLFTMAGYTNMNDGTLFHIIMDANLKGDRYYGDRQWTTKAMYHGGMNFYRTWNISFAVDMSNLFPGPHSMTIYSDEGATMTVPFYKYSELPPHHIDQQHIEFIGNSPFIPPVYINTTIIKEVPGPIQIVKVPVTPAPEVVQAAADRAAQSTAALSAIIGVILIIAFFAAVWIRNAYRRAKDA